MASTPAFIPHDPAQAPTCSWRGVAVDPTHSFWPIPSLKLVLSLMSRYRLTVMRWRLCAGSSCLLSVPGFPFDTGAGARPATPATPRTGLVHAHPRKCPGLVPDRSHVSTLWPSPSGGSGKLPRMSA